MWCAMLICCGELSDVLVHDFELLVPVLTVLVTKHPVSHQTDRDHLADSASSVMKSSDLLKACVTATIYSDDFQRPVIPESVSALHIDSMCDIDLL
jgi:hypothetical protein